MEKEEEALSEAPATLSEDADMVKPSTTENVPHPPVKKASSIIGKAIAKAMARESTAREGSREGSPMLYSPVSSRGSTPASFSRDSTPASSILDTDDSTPVSTNSLTNTPRSTPDRAEDNNGEIIG